MKVPHMYLVYSWHGSSVKLWSGTQWQCWAVPLLLHLGAAKTSCSLLFPSSLVRNFHFFSLLISWWKPNQFKPLRWGCLKGVRGWVLGRLPTGTLWGPLKQVSANCSSFEAAVIRLQNLMKRLGFSWGNLDVKDNCLIIACCSVGRIYSPKYFYYHCPSISQELGLSTQQRRSRDTTFTLRAQTAGWFQMPEMGLKSTLAT